MPDPGPFRLPDIRDLDPASLNAASDREVIFRFAHECQAIAGRLVVVEPYDLPRILRQFARVIPTPSKPFARAIVHHLVMSLVLRVRAIVPGWRAEWDARLLSCLGSYSLTGHVTRVVSLMATLIDRAHEGRSSNAPPTRPEGKALAALDIVRHCYEDCSFNLRTAASEVNLTPSHLDRLLTRYTGNSFVHHLRTARLHAAKQLLTSTLLSIKEVAAKVGYNSVTHLDRDFRRHVGCSPTEWRGSRGPSSIIAGNGKKRRRIARKDDEVP